MANLSNINGKFVVEQTTGYVGVGTTDPSYPIEVLNASAEIALNASGGSIYRLKSDSTDSFRINKNAVGDRLVIDSSGYVGISVSTPSDYYAKNLVVTGPAEGGITIASTGNHTNYLLFADSTSGVARYAGMVGYAHDTDLMSFRTNSIQRMAIDSSGRVGIGITPSLADVKLHTYNNSTNAYNIFESSTRKWVFGQVGDVAQVAGVYGLHGGVQVDGATGDVGIGTDSPGARIDIKGVSGSPATSGTTQNGILRIQNATNNNTLDIGQVAGSPYGTWLQAADKSDLNPIYTYPILLNPLGGRVGIGTASTEGKLTISYTAAELPTSGTTSNSAIQVISSLGNQLNLGLNTVSGDYGGYIQVSDNNLAVPYPLNLQPNGGNVGIGTTSPSAQLEVQETGITVANTQDFVASFIGEGYGTGQVLIADSATIAADKGGELQFGGKYTGNSLTEWVTIGGYKDNGTDGQYGGYFKVTTRPNGGGAIERMRIDSDGLVTLASMSSNDTRQLTFMGDSNSTSGNGGAIGMFADETRITSNWYYNSGQQKYVAGNGQAVIGLNTGATDATSNIFFAVNGPAAAAGPTLRMRINSSGDVGIGTTPETAGATWRTLFIGASATIVSRQSAAGYDSIFANNYYVNSSNQDRVRTTGPSSRMFLDGNNIRFQTSPSTGVGGAPSWSEIMRIDANGNVGINTTSPLNKLQVGGDIGIGEINSTRSTNVRFAKNDVNVITFDISVAAIGAWRPGSCWIQVSGSQNGLQEYWSAWYFIRLTHYYLSGVAGQGTTNPSCILDSGGDTSQVIVGVSSTNSSNPQIITITLTDSGGTTNSMVADINCTMQVGINSIT